MNDSLESPPTHAHRFSLLLLLLTCACVCVDALSSACFLACCSLSIQTLTNAREDLVGDTQREADVCVCVCVFELESIVVIINTHAANN